MEIDSDKIKAFFKRKCYCKGLKRFKDISCAPQICIYCKLYAELMQAVKDPDHDELCERTMCYCQKRKRQAK